MKIMIALVPKDYDLKSGQKPLVWKITDRLEGDTDDQLIAKNKEWLHEQVSLLGLKKGDVRCIIGDAVRVDRGTAGETDYKSYGSNL